MGIVILVPLALVFFYLVYMPQQKQKKAQAALLAALDEGDAVLTTGGIYGVIAEVDGDSVYLEVAPGIELHVSKAAVLRKVVETSDSTSEGK